MTSPPGTGRATSGASRSNVGPSPPRPDRRDVAAVAAVLASLVVAYVLVPDPAVQFGAWLVVFCVWMLWFVAFGVRWVYGEDAD